MKTQSIRLLDVFLIGPLMMSAGRRVAAQGGNIEGGLLMLLGFATVAYNGANYMTYARGERLVGGRASGRTPLEFNPRQLRRGVKVEMEHTTDPEVAREIAMDHLTEDPQYYDKLIRAGL